MRLYYTVFPRADQALIGSENAGREDTTDDISGATSGNGAGVAAFGGKEHH